MSAWHLRRKYQVEFFTKAVKIAAPYTLIMALLVGLAGHQQGIIVAKYQPAKRVAMECPVETQAPAPMYLIAWPDQANSKNSIEALPVPGLLSLLAFNNFNAEVKGLNAFPKDDIPPVLPVFLSFRLMVAFGSLFILLAAWAWLKRKNIGENPLLAKILIWTIPLPYIAIMAGWTIAEVGRQPWIVYNLMRTSDAVSPIPGSSVALSILAFIIIDSFLWLVDIYRIMKYASKGPSIASPSPSESDSSAEASSSNNGEKASTDNKEGAIS